MLPLNRQYGIKQLQMIKEYLGGGMLDAFKLFIWQRNWETKDY